MIFSEYSGMRSAEQLPKQPVERKNEISPFMANLLSALASEVGGRVDLDESKVISDCGFIMLAQEGADRVSVHRLYVEEEKRGQGCGTALIQALIRVVSKMVRRTTTISLWPVRTAIGFYLRLGFSLYVSSDEEADYHTMKEKLYGPPGKAALAKIRLAVEGAADGGPWTHEILWPLFEKSGMPLDRPKFYSLWVSDIARGDYEHAEITVQPSRGRLLATNV